MNKNSIAQIMRISTQDEHKQKLDEIFKNLPKTIKDKMVKLKFCSQIKYSEADFPMEWFSLSCGMYKDELLKWTKENQFKIKIFEYHECQNKKKDCVENCLKEQGIEFHF